MPQDLGAINALRKARDSLFVFKNAQQKIQTFAPTFQSNTLNDLARMHDKLDGLIKQIEKNSLDDLRK